VYKVGAGLYLFGAGELLSDETCLLELQVYTCSAGTKKSSRLCKSALQNIQVWLKHPNL
jgi:hypothetical protein